VLVTVASLDTIPPKELAGQAVLVRVDAEDEVKLRDSLPTLARVSEAGARVVIATHYGSGPNAPRLDHIAIRLTELLGRPVGKLDEWKGEASPRAVNHLGEGAIMMIENLAFEAGEQAGDGSLADALARLCDIYCNDVFALSHEVRASTVGVAKKAKRAVAGLAFERELGTLEAMGRERRGPALALLGGELTKEKLLLAEEIAQRSERTLLAGQLVLPFLVARELLPKKKAVTEEMVKIAERMMREARADKRIITTPADFTVVDKQTFERLSRDEPAVVLAPPLQNVREDEITADQILCDIGRATRWSWSDGFGPARTIFWHGPVGVCEIDLFCEGSRFLAAALAQRTSPALHPTVVCGTSLATALRRIGFPTEEIRHLTHAGRAALYYFARRPLPAVEVLREADATKRKPFRILIPLNGSDRDTSSVQAAAEMAARDAEIFLLHVRPGPDEEQYPDLVAALSEAERLERRIESERIFARANAILAARGLLSARQIATQGRPTKVILRYAQRMGAQLVVLVAAGGLASFGARRVLEQAPCATLVARPHTAAGRTKAWIKP
jgi:phosphoglycerate kinase